MRFKNRSGFTVLEVSVALVMLFLGVAAIQMAQSSNDKNLKSLRVNGLVSAEHRTLLALIQSIPVSEAQSTLIDKPGGCFPHPFDSFQKFKSGSDNCLNNPAAGTFDRTKWENLSRTYFESIAISSNPIVSGSEGVLLLNPVINPVSYKNIFLPKLISNGCIACHNTGSPNGSFANYADVVIPASIGTNNPKISLFGLGSPMGRRLLRPQMLFKSIRDPGGRLRELSSVIHMVNFSAYRRQINSNNDQTKFEWNCRLGTRSYVRNKVGDCSMAGVSCPVVGGEVGMVLTNGSSCQCVNDPSTGKKGHPGCTPYFYWDCAYPSISRSALINAPETNNPYCTHGVVKPTSVVWPNKLNTPKECYKRYPTGDSSNSYYTSWECYNPADGTYQKTQSRWEISYTLETQWQTIDGSTRTINSEGILK